MTSQIESPTGHTNQEKLLSSPPSRNSPSPGPFVQLDSASEHQKNSEKIDILFNQLNILLTTATEENWSEHYEQISFILETEHNLYIPLLDFYRKLLYFASWDNTFSSAKKYPADLVLERVLQSFEHDPKFFEIFLRAWKQLTTDYNFDVLGLIKKFKVNTATAFILASIDPFQSRPEVKTFITDHISELSELASEEKWGYLLVETILLCKSFPFLNKLIIIGVINAFEKQIPPVQKFFRSVLTMSFKDILVEIGPEHLMADKLLPALLQLKPDEIDNSIALILAEVLIPGSQGLSTSSGGVTNLTFVNNVPEASAKGAQLQACLRAVESHPTFVINWFAVFAKAQEYLFDASKRKNEPSLASITQFITAVDFKQGVLDTFLSYDWWFDKTLIFIIATMTPSRGCYDILNSPYLTLCFPVDKEAETPLKFVNLSKKMVQVIVSINAKSLQRGLSQSRGDKNLEYWLLSYFDQQCTSFPHFVIAGALAIPDKDGYVLDRIDRLFTSIMDKELKGGNAMQLIEVLEKFKELDINLAIAKLIDYYATRMSPQSLNKVVGISFFCKILDELLKKASSMQFKLYLNLLLEATRIKYDIRFAVETEIKNPKTKSLFYQSLFDVLEARTAQDFEKGQQMQQSLPEDAEGYIPSEALGVKTVFYLLEVLKGSQGIIDAESLKNLQLSALTTYPRLINFGTGHDQAILANEERFFNVFPPQVEQEMKAYYSKMYSKEMEIKEIVDMLTRMKNSDDPHDQDIFACMIHSLIDEYRFFSEYPLTALASTSLLFGALLQKNLIQGTTLTVALNFIWESCNQPQDSHLFKFAVQSLYNFKSRLHEYPIYCKHLLKCQSLSAHAKMYQIVKDASNGKPCPDTATALVTRGDSNTPVKSEVPSVVYNSVAAVPKTIGFASQEDPNENVSDKLLFLVNNMTADNMNSKLPELKDLLVEKYFSWFSTYLVGERAKAEPNNHGLYGSLVLAVDNHIFYEYVLNTTLLEVQRLLQGFKDTTSERSHIKNLGSWLGKITLAHDKPLKRDQVALKYLLVEAFDYNTLHVVIPFACKVLDQASFSKIFRPPNPWTLGIVKVLVELYKCADLKLNLKFEIEVLLNALDLKLADVEPSLLVRTHNSNPDALAALFGNRPEMALPVEAGPQLAGEPSEAMHMQQLYQQQQQQALLAQLQHQQQIPEAVLPQAIDEPGVPAQGVNQLDASFSNLSGNTVFTQNPNLRRAFQASLARAVRECAVPILSRVSEAVLTTTEALIKKDFATEADVSKFRKAYLILAQHLSHSMVVCSGRKILVETIEATMLQLLGSQVSQSDLPFADLNIAIQSNVDLCVDIVEKLASSNIAELIEERMRAQVVARERNPPGKPFIGEGASEYSLHLPPPLGLQPEGLSESQLNMYMTFGSNAFNGVNEGAVLAQTPQEAAATPVAQVQTPSGQPVPMIPTSQLPQGPPGADFTAERANVPPQMTPQQSFNTLQQEELNTVDQLTAVITQMCEKAIKLLAPLKETSLASLPAEHPILQSLSQALSICQTNALVHPELLLKVAQYAVNCLFTQAHENPMCTEIYVVILDRLCEYSPSTAKDVTWWMVHSVDQRKFNMPVIFSLMKVQLVTPSKLDSSIGKLIAESNSPVLVKFASSLLLSVLNANEVRPIALRSDFAVTLNALSKFSGDEASEDYKQAKAVRDKLFSSLSTLHNPPLPSVENRPPTAYVQMGYVFSEWVKLLGHEDEGEDVQKSFVDALLLRGILTEPHKFEMFFKAATEVAVSAFGAEHEIRTRTQREVYLAVDCLAMLIVRIALRFPVSASNDAIEYIKTILGIVSLVIVNEHETSKVTWNERAYFRLFSSILTTWSTASIHKPDATAHLDHLFFPMFAEVLNGLQPIAYPGFTFAWIPLISHRMFLPKLLALPDRAGYHPAVKMLTALLKFQTVYFKDESAHDDVISVIFRAINRIFVALAHDSPEFLVSCHYMLMNAVPACYLQLRNIILVATPAGTAAPNPHDSSIDIKSEGNAWATPPVLYAPIEDLHKVGLKKPVENYLRIPAPALMRTIHLGTKLSQPKESFEFGYETIHYSIKLINALVLHVGISAAEERLPKNPQVFNVKSSQTSLIVDLLNIGSSEFRYHVISAIANNLRYPNSHTQWFACLMMYLFQVGEWNSDAIRDEVQEIIIRVLLERSVAKPTPWAIPVVMRGIMHGGEKNVMDMKFVKTAPEEVKAVLESVTKAYGSVN